MKLYEEPVVQRREVEERRQRPAPVVVEPKQRIEYYDDETYKDGFANLLSLLKFGKHPIIQKLIVFAAGFMTAWVMAFVLLALVWLLSG